MPNTPIFGYPYPAGGAANDYPADMAAYVLAVETEQARQGPLESRPAPGKQGARYFATTRQDPYSSPVNAVVPWNVLYHDNGTQWVQLSESNVQTFPATSRWHADSGALFVVSYDVVQTHTYEYSLSRTHCELNVQAYLALVGSNDQKDVVLDLPVNALTGALVPVVAQNWPMKGYVDPTVQRLRFSPAPDFNSGRWVADSVSYWFRATVRYRIA